MTSFRQEDIPVSMCIVIDNSGSMREKRDKVNKAALNLVRASNPHDEVCVVNFNDEYYLDQPFTSKLTLLKEALEKVEARGGTALYDAMVATSSEMKAHARLQKKVLFVVTDGEDNASRESLEETVRNLQQENGPTVYAIGLLGEEKGTPRTPRSGNRGSGHGRHCVLAQDARRKWTKSAALSLTTFAASTPSATSPPPPKASAATAPSRSKPAPRDTRSSWSGPAAATTPARSSRASWTPVRKRFLGRSFVYLRVLCG